MLCRSRSPIAFCILMLAMSTALAQDDLKEAEPKIGPAEAAQPVETVEPGGPWKLTIEQAILLAIARNRSLRVEALQPAIVRTDEAIERAEFDPLIGGTAAYGRRRDDAPGRTPRGGHPLTRENTAEVFIEEFLPTGTTLRAQGTGAIVDSDLYSDSFSSARAGLTVTQALLRGRPIRVNLARLHQAQIETRISDYELRAFVESLVENVETTYWDLALADRRIAILQQSLAIAEQQLQDTVERVDVGTLAESELAAARAEVGRRNEELIDARSFRAVTQLELLRLINPEGPLWQRALDTANLPTTPDGNLDPVAAHVALAEQLRPDLNQARLQIEQGDIEVVRTRNGLLPRLDLFLTFGTTGYAQAFDDAVKQVDGQDYDLTLGVTAEHPILNRAPRAEHRRARLNRRQLHRALDNLTQLVQLEVRTAYIEVERARQQVAATAETLRYHEQSLAAETEKFKVGKSSSILVAQAQRDLLTSQLNAVDAVVAYLQALVRLYRVEGSLLERRGLVAPGMEPVEYEATDATP